ncbi:MAG: Crp/Fnr family transcriptional regulator [Saprospiraceae bacterium]|nr:Crp/Fnr family transcriptional regulator [Saprospiraceae bacterium]
MNLPEIVNAIKDFSLSKCLSDKEILYLINSSNLRTLEKHGLIFQSGQPSIEIFFLLNGVVKITMNASDGREVIKTILHPKAILSEHSIAGEEIRNNNATVMTPTAIYLAVKVEVINELMINNPQLAVCVINFLGRKLKYSEERLESLVLNDARERIVQFLKVNAQSFGQPIGFELLLKHDFTQQDIANFTGTSRQTVTTVLNDLKKTNKIHFKRKSILIRDIKALC